MLRQEAKIKRFLECESAPLSTFEANPRVRREMDRGRYECCGIAASERVRVMAYRHHLRTHFGRFG